MTPRARQAWRSFLGIVVAASGCSESNLDAITQRRATSDGLGGSGTGGSTGHGSGGSGGSGTREAGGDGGSGSPPTAAAGGGRGGDSGGDSGRGGGGGTAGSTDAGSLGVISGAAGTPEGGTEASGCPAPALRPGDTDESVEVGSVTRSYFLHVPSTYDASRPVPLIVDFHFLGNSGSQEQLISPFPTVTAAEGVIIAFPNGESGPGGTAWNVGPCCVAEDVDDVAFARALVAQLRSKACIDEKRIYAVGFALGGGMAHYVGCHASDLFAAIAPVGFDLLEENVDDCHPTRPITVVAFREASDGVAPYDGGPWTLVPEMPITLLGAEATFSKWAELNECTVAPSTRDSNGCASYGNCRDGVEVVLCTKEAGVPAADNGTIAWPILQRHPMP